MSVKGMQEGDAVADSAGHHVLALNQCAHKSGLVANQPKTSG
jgi:hypothetical protein